MQESIWNGYRRINFKFRDRECILVFPSEANAKRSWLLKTEYFGAFPALEVEMLSRGWHLAYIKNVTRWCIDEDIDLKAEFIKYLIAEYSLSERCVPVGMSCGGMIACKLAAKYPEYISVLYLDAPVMNLLSCPAGLGIGGNDLFPEFQRSMGMSLSELISYREHPIDKMPALLANNIPVILVYGDSDSVVPYCENGALLEKYYKDNGGTVVAIGKPGCGHHPHGLEDNTPIVKFIEKYS